MLNSLYSPLRESSLSSLKCPVQALLKLNSCCFALRLRLKVSFFVLSGFIVLKLPVIRSAVFGVATSHVMSLIVRLLSKSVLIFLSLSWYLYCRISLGELITLDIFNVSMFKDFIVLENQSILASMFCAMLKPSLSSVACSKVIPFTLICAFFNVMFLNPA